MARSPFPALLTTLGLADAGRQSGQRANRAPAIQLSQACPFLGVGGAVAHGQLAADPCTSFKYRLVGSGPYALFQLASIATRSLAGIIGSFAADGPLSSCGVLVDKPPPKRYERPLRQGTS